MIRRLRIKFVCINMTIVAIMLCAIFIMLMSFTRVNLERESIGMMQEAALDPVHLGLPGETGGRVRLPYFTVQLGPTGEPVSTAGGYYDLSDTDLLAHLVRLSSSGAQQTGVLKEYSLRYCTVTTPGGRYIVFADMSSEINTLNNLLQTCLLIGILSFAAFFVISILLAHWAVKPVEQAWTQQKQFVADASHELKTPLTVILSSTQLLSETGEDEAMRKRLTENIFSMSRQMKGLVESLLELARVDSGITEKSFAPLDLSRLVSEALLPFEPVFFEQELALESRVEEGIVVRGSAPHLKQATDILLDNARKYAEPRSRVELVLCRSGKKHCLLSVKSQGAQLTPRELKDIFKRFYRADSARSRDGSYGLGLSIAEGIVKVHRGRIWAESRDGANTFFIRLPLCRRKRQRAPRRETLSEQEI